MVKQKWYDAHMWTQGWERWRRMNSYLRPVCSLGVNSCIHWAACSTLQGKNKKKLKVKRDARI